MAAICLPPWFAPVVALGLRLGRGDIFVRTGRLFSKAAVTASVVGVVLNLFLIFTRHMVFPEAGPRVGWFALVAAVVAFLGMHRIKWGMIPVIAGSALAGGVWKWVAP